MAGGALDFNFTVAHLRPLHRHLADARLNVPPRPIAVAPHSLYFSLVFQLAMPRDELPNLGFHSCCNNSRAPCRNTSVNEFSYPPFELNSVLGCEPSLEQHLIMRCRPE